MSIKKRIKKNKKIISMITDELIKEDIIYKVMEVDSKICRDFREASKIRVYLEGVDKAYSYAYLNLRLIKYIEACYKNLETTIEVEKHLNILLDDVSNSITLLIKYILTEKHFYEEAETTYEVAENIVYYNELKDHMASAENRRKQLSN